MPPVPPPVPPHAGERMQSHLQQLGRRLKEGGLVRTFQVSQARVWGVRFRADSCAHFKSLTTTNHP